MAVIGAVVGVKQMKGAPGLPVRVVGVAEVVITEVRAVIVVGRGSSKYGGAVTYTSSNRGGGSGGYSSSRGGYSSGQGGYSSSRGGYSSGQGGYSNNQGSYSSGQSSYSSSQGNPSGQRSKGYGQQNLYPPAPGYSTSSYGRR
ncbi:abscisic acid and environmental stress-inducible protein-like [Homalodisca vitripennis]|uniref:abscisic acid and environmental stress-inducible protein-like n=1 Tax=Homalodisca vitripennis TaxID=197043 RepID=UPI001EEA587E|nr:abscisic acid and environmental stress-inducible protein-like [Homalodisca vitripennis]